MIWYQNSSMRTRTELLVFLTLWFATLQLVVSAVQSKNGVECSGACSSTDTSGTWCYVAKQGGTCPSGSTSGWGGCWDWCGSTSTSGSTGTGSTSTGTGCSSKCAGRTGIYCGDIDLSGSQSVSMMNQGCGATISGNVQGCCDCGGCSGSSTSSGKHFSSSDLFFCLQFNASTSRCTSL
jgi:hypothetical protein